MTLMTQPSGPGNTEHARTWPKKDSLFRRNVVARLLGFSRWNGRGIGCGHFHLRSVHTFEVFELQTKRAPHVWGHWGWGWGWGFAHRVCRAEVSAVLSPKRHVTRDWAAWDDATIGVNACATPLIRAPSRPPVHPLHTSECPVGRACLPRRVGTTYPSAVPWGAAPCAVASPKRHFGISVSVAPRCPPQSPFLPWV